MLRPNGNAFMFRRAVIVFWEFCRNYRRFDDDLADPVVSPPTHACAPHPCPPSKSRSFADTPRDESGKLSEITNRARHTAARERFRLQLLTTAHSQRKRNLSEAREHHGETSETSGPFEKTLTTSSDGVLVREEKKRDIPDSYESTNRERYCS